MQGEWGTFCFPAGHKCGQFTGSLDPELKQAGLTEDEWEEIRKLLRKGKGRLVVDAKNPATGRFSMFGFSHAVKIVNEKFLDKLGCIGVYSEYRNGMKSMTVYTKAAWNAKPK